MPKHAYVNLFGVACSACSYTLAGRSDGLRWCTDMEVY